MESLSVLVALVALVSTTWAYQQQSYGAGQGGRGGGGGGGGRLPPQLASAGQQQQRGGAYGGSAAAAGVGYTAGGGGGAFGQQQVGAPAPSDQDPDGDSIVGIAGRDYPVYSEVPNTGFSCASQQLPGYYADTNAQCQVFHICQQGNVQDSFLCPNGSIFNQRYFVCDWWYNVDCNEATSLYGLNADLYREPAAGYSSAAGYTGGGGSSGGGGGSYGGAAGRPAASYGANTKTGYGGGSSGY